MDSPWHRCARRPSLRKRTGGEDFELAPPLCAAERGQGVSPLADSNKFTTLFD